MTQPSIDTLVWVRIKADYITLTQRLQPGASLHGKLLGIDPALLPLPTEDNPGTLAGLSGFAVAADPGEGAAWIWIVRVGLDDVTRDFIRDIPGPGGWTDPNLDQTRNVYRRYARKLINEYGVDPEFIRPMLLDLFNAAKVELL